jgi:hypothetical protein
MHEFSLVDDLMRESQRHSAGRRSKQNFQREGEARRPGAYLEGALSRGLRAGSAWHARYGSSADIEIKSDERSVRAG